MGATTSKVEVSDKYNLIQDEKITVHFVQLRKINNTQITPEQLNILFGLNLPKYSILEGTFYPFLYCVSSLIDVTTIANDYGYEVGYLTKQTIHKDQFNAYHKATCLYSNADYYRLERI